MTIGLTTVTIWPAFSSAQGDGHVALSLWVGAVSILLMAWSFVLAIRLRALEPWFGGMDRVYRSHRWAGALAIPTMWLHTSIEPDIRGGIRGASRSIADSASDLAGTGETMLYLLVGASLLRWIPYRYWRWTHKLLGLPFVFASWHFFTAQKPYANTSAWGWFFNAVMLIGTAAWLHRVVVLDMFARGRPYRVVRSTIDDTTIEIELEPLGSRLRHHAGQFAFVKLDLPGLREPHAFTIASSPDEANLRFYIRDLGDWSNRLLDADLLGAAARIEGPYGHFQPTRDSTDRTIWVAGGVGITPFLSAIGQLEPAPKEHRPLLIYAVRQRAGATALEALTSAAADGRIALDVVVSSEGRRFSPAMFAAAIGDARPQRCHVATCGPSGLTDAVISSARNHGIASIEYEAFDMRSGIGPDLSRDIDAALPSTPRRLPLQEERTTTPS